MKLPPNTTLAELHEIKATCLDCFTLDGCDSYCPYWQFNVDGYLCAFGCTISPHEWELPSMKETEDNKDES